MTANIPSGTHIFREFNACGSVVEWSDMPFILLVMFFEVKVSQDISCGTVLVVLR